MLGCHAATVTRCDSRSDFGAYPCYGYSAAEKPFDTCLCRGYSIAAREPFQRLPLPHIQRESSRLLYNIVGSSKLIASGFIPSLCWLHVLKETEAQGEYQGGHVR